ncbi:uncharacterized protein LOC118645842 [Monomorium pharaonis]|uniref:uncharacterized protein LOC118645842 n=1 Tax=Monomorium pharaonis TaxID=307658 RepID=UPI00174701D9|nr:uncharacterized protein LOC118645842 [Monomorium pharaonis]
MMDVGEEEKRLMNVKERETETMDIEEELQIMDTEEETSEARICSLHFQDDCFEMKWTTLRGTNVPKELCRLKKNSVPNVLLHLEKKTKLKAKVKEVILTYAELVKYAQQKQQMQKHNGHNLCEILKEGTVQEANTLGLNIKMEETNTINEENANEQKKKPYKKQILLD